MLSINDIQIRDPFVLTVPEEGCYYLYGTTDKDPWGVHAQGFQAYKSSDLKIWEGPYPVFSPPADFWADRNFWAPEVHRYRGAYYMPASFKSAEHRRAFLERGWGGESFHEIVNNLRTSDPYMVMADFADYRRAQNDLSGLYRDRGVWNRMSLMNIANAGIFSADRAVNDYARDIWHVKPIK